MDSQKDAVTWLLPVLNGAQFLEPCLSSIERQTYKHFEVIAWDNGSSDDSQDLLAAWIPGRLPGKVITDRPLPLGACLAALVEAAPTSLCARMDADDICEPERLAAQVAFLRSHREVVAVGSQVRSLEADGTLGDIYHPLPLRHESIVLRLLRLWSLYHPTILFRREAVLAAGNYGNERPGQDYALWLRLAQVGRLANLPQALLRYRIHTRSVTSECWDTRAVMEKQRRTLVINNSQALYGCEPNELESLLDLRLPDALLSQIKVVLSLLKQPNIRKVDLIRDPILLRDIYALSRKLITSVIGRCANL